jgi:hypothetical protein
MSSLTINPKWNSEINQVENGEPISGGTLGNANLATRQLGENIFYLKQKTENDLLTKANKADIYTKTETNTNFAKKSTTLNGYGITDAYTKTQIDNLVISKTGDLGTLKTTDKTTLVKSINEVYDNTKGVVDLYNRNILAGAGTNGWDANLVAYGEITQKQINDGLESIAQLASINNPRNGQRVVVKSYHTPNYALLNPFKGGATFVYDTTKSSINNYATVINGWVRQFKSELQASDGGCKEGDFDNTALLNNLINVASENKCEIVLDGMYKISTLEKGITTTRFGDEPIYWMLKAKSNVSIRGRNKTDGLILGGGLVASNASEANTKGYCVFGDGNATDIKNFTIKDFTIDNNGQNNLLQPINSHGSQSLCPNVWFQRGDTINVSNVLFKDNPGHQTIVLDKWVTNATVVDCEFIDNGAGLDNNIHINDHSTIYCRADNYTIRDNKFTFTNNKQPDISTALELHGSNGDVYGNRTVGYPFALVRASYDMQNSRNVRVHDNTFENCVKVCEFDGGAGSTLIVDIYDNIALLRSKKPSNGRVNAAFGHNQYNFASVGTATANYIEINLKRNKVTQLGTKSDWSTWNHSDNLIFIGGKYNKVTTEGNEFINFSSGYSVDYNNNLASYSFNDKLTDCGYNFDASRGAINALIRQQNLDSAWASGQTKYIECFSTLRDCKFDAIIANLADKTVLDGVYKISSNTWIVPSIGYSVNSANTANFDYSVQNVGSLDIGNMSTKAFGKIRLADGNYFYKKYGTNKKWNMYREYYAPTAPTAPRVFGDVVGDTVQTTEPIAGQPLIYACIASSANANTGGTWKAVATVAQ